MQILSGYWILLIISLAISYSLININKNKIDSNVWINISDSSWQEIKLSHAAEILTIHYSKDHKHRAAIMDHQGKIQKTFITNSAFNEFLNHFQPMTVIRKLGKDHDLNLYNYGLDKVAQSLAIITNQENRILHLGDPIVTNDKIYALDKNLSEVILIDSYPISKLMQADKIFFESYLLPKNIKNITALSIEHADQKAWFQKGHTWQAKPYHFSPTHITKLIEDILHTRALSYAHTLQAKHLRSLPPLFSLSLFTHNEPQIDLQFFHRDQDLESSNRYWVRSSFLNSYVNISTNRFESIYNYLKSSLTPTK